MLQNENSFPLNEQKYIGSDTQYYHLFPWHNISITRNYLIYMYSVSLYHQGAVNRTCIFLKKRLALILGTLESVLPQLYNIREIFECSFPAALRWQCPTISSPLKEEFYARAWSTPTTRRSTCAVAISEQNEGKLPLAKSIRAAALQPCVIRCAWQLIDVYGLNALKALLFKEKFL